MNLAFSQAKKKYAASMAISIAAIFSAYKFCSDTHPVDTVAAKTHQRSDDYPAMLDYESMSDVKSLINSNAQAGTCLSKLLESYNPYMSLSGLKQLYSVFSGTGIPSYRDLSVNSSPANSLSQEFLVNLAHGMWVEKNHAVPWSLADYSKDQIMFLFPSAPRDSRTYPAGILSTDISAYEEMDPYKLFPIASKLMRKTAAETAQRAVEWVGNTFVHFRKYSGDPTNPNDIWPYDYTDKYPQIESIFENRAVFGCWGTSSLSAAALRSLNIPAQSIAWVWHGLKSNAGDWQPQTENHGGLMLPSLDLFSHGDWLLTAGQNGSELLYSYKDFMHLVRQVTIAEVTNGPNPPSRFYNPSPNNFGIEMHHPDKTSNVYYFKWWYAVDSTGVAQAITATAQGGTGYYVAVPIAFENGDINQPAPGFSAMVRNLSAFGATYSQVLGFPSLVVVSTPSFKIKGLAELRSEDGASL